MSKQDSKFFNVFSVVLGLLIALSLVLFGLARVVGDSTQRAHVLEDAKYASLVESHIRPLARVAVAGQDNSALEIRPAAGSADTTVAEALPTDGLGVYQAACTACHSAGIAGAPKSGDKAQWAPRLAKGKETLYKHAIEGFQGEGGVMPAKGGRADLSDELVKLAVDYMMELNR